jgi:hypothetical protein
MSSCRTPRSRRWSRCRRRSPTPRRSAATAFLRGEACNDFPGNANHAIAGGTEERRTERLASADCRTGRRSAASRTSTTTDITGEARP